jgi:hypothetical protein
MGHSEAPKFLIKATFESNTAFFVAIFCLISFVAWGLRDHRRRQLELATEEQEDRLYMTLLSGMFTACTAGAYQIFRKQKLKREYEGQGHLVPIEQMVDKKVDEIMDTVLRRASAGTIYTDEDEDFRFFMYGLMATATVLVFGWLLTRTGHIPKATQQPSRGTAHDDRPPH